MSKKLASVTNLIIILLVTVLVQASVENVSVDATSEAEKTKVGAYYYV